MVRVGLGQHLRIGPVVALIERPDPAEQFLVGHGALEHLDHLTALVVARALDVGTGGGDDEHQRLTPGAHTGQHGVVLS
ncbi:hypothetical protein D3C84_950790 [compost metagenome]